MAESMVSPVLIGRREELSELSALLAQALGGEPAFALISGEAGVGKTRLASELTRQAEEAGFRVLTGQCVELGAEGLPLAPLVDALRTLAQTMPREELGSVLGPAARRGLAGLLPELALDTDPPAFPGLPGEGPRKSQLLELVLGAMTRLSAVKPVMFVIEDLHWADQSTLDLTAFLVRALRAAPVMLAITYRSDELHRRHPLRPLVSSWERDRSLTRFELRRFDRDEVSALLEALLGETPRPDVVDVIFGRSGGNAYFVEELADVVRSDGDPADLPPSLRDVLLTRVDALSDDAQRMLRTASVAGLSVPDRLLAEVMGLEKAELFATLREVVENHLLAVEQGGYRYSFRHALTRDAVYEDMLPGERVELHAAYGEALSTDPDLAGLDGEAALPATLAYHWYAALDLPRALSSAIDAAVRATASYAADEALRHLERALEIWPRVPDAEQRTRLDRAEVARLAGEAALRTGAAERSKSLLANAIAALPAAAAPVRRALLLQRYAVTQRYLGVPQDAAATLREALALLPSGEATRAHAVVLAALATAQADINDKAGSAETARQAIDAARTSSAPDVQADAEIRLGLSACYLGEAEAGIESLRAGLRLARDLDIPDTALTGYIYLADVLELLGRHSEAVQAAAEGHQMAVRAGLTQSVYGAYLAANQVEPLVRLGRWNEAGRVITEALAAQPEGSIRAGLLQMRAEIAAMRGQYEQAAADLSETRRAMGDLAGLQVTQPTRYISALVALGLGDVATARSAVAPGLASDHLLWAARYGWPVAWLAMRAEADEAEMFRVSREVIPDRIPERCEEIRRASAAMPTPAPRFLAYQALVAAEQDRAVAAQVSQNDEARPTAAAEAWRKAVAAWREPDEPYLLAYALLRLAQAGASSGERLVAIDAAREAHTIAEQLGAAALAAEAAAFTRKARVSLTAGPEPPMPAGKLSRFGLTDREREVALLVAEGRSNPEIAKILFISAKTASVHVSNILAKLGVGGRVEAAALINRLGTAE
jgi:DNA-binding CsgD family transcriptional regulator/tetratricopeptide (TPR) repeat protein